MRVNWRSTALQADKWGGVQVGGRMDQDNAVSSSSENTEREEVQVPPQETRDDDAAPDTTEEQHLPPPENPPTTTAAPESPRIKHDWYQTHADVVVSVMIKKLRREDVSVEFEEGRLKVDINLGEGETRSLAFDLAHPIVKEKSSFKVLTTKVSGKCV